MKLSDFGLHRLIQHTEVTVPDGSGVSEGKVLTLNAMDSGVQLWLQRTVDATLDHQGKLSPSRVQTLSSSRSSIPTTISAARSDYRAAVLVGV